jgi:predicted Fe-Mo cluster-binding NifX family protein/NAD-dependent dihydropyrimidine dehydrogenase PreA subunit
MKVAVTCSGPTLDGHVEARFGRCPYFLIVDTESMQFEAVENPNMALGGGAGIQSAQMMAERGVSYVLTGNCGPNAFAVFGQAGVNVIVGVTGPARKAVERFKSGEYASAAAPNVQSHFGMRTDGPLDAGLDGALTRKPGMGMGRGGGMGGGRGMGRGRGMGLGMGWVSGIGPGGFQSMRPPRENLPVNPPLLSRVDGPTRQIDQGGVRVSTPRGGRKAVALVRPERCGGCGICVDVCQVGAIRIEQRAVVDPALCTACAACVAECPNEAVIIVQQRL